jgi:xanthosine utilization system XapX-like protein
VVPPVKRLIAGEKVTVAWFHQECMPKITGTPGPTLAAQPECPDNGESRAS